MQQPRRLMLGLAAAVIVVADRLSKLWIESNVGPMDTLPVVENVFNIVHTRNPGAAFGMLATAPEAVRKAVLVVGSAVLLCFLLWMWWKETATSKSNSWLAISLTLVVAGAVGNLYDRIVAGEVTDFLQVFIGSYEWPSFNVADSAISVGAVLLLIEMIRHKPGPAAS
jgi:signal peptidase II